NCRAAAILLRAAHFHLQSSTIESCDVGVDVAENASNVLLEHNRFANDRVGVRFTAANRDTVVAGNSFIQDKVAGLWAVRGDAGARGAAAITVRANRVHNCGYGIAFVLGDPAHPSTAVDNTIIEPKFNGIDVIGDSPILRHNQVLQPHLFALHVVDFRQPGAQNVRSQPLLEGNNFRADALQVDNAPVPATARPQ